MKGGKGTSLLQCLACAPPTPLAFTAGLPKRMALPQTLPRSLDDVSRKNGEIKMQNSRLGRANRLRSTVISHA